MNHPGIFASRLVASTATILASLAASTRVKAYRRFVLILSLVSLIFVAQSAHASHGGPGWVQTETGVNSSASPSIYFTPVTFSVAVFPSTCGQNGVWIDVYDNGGMIAHVILNSQGQGWFTTNTLSVGTHTITATFPGNVVGATQCLSSTSQPALAQVVNSRPGTEGLLLPKFVVLDVLYAPPGCGNPPTCTGGSSVTYSNTSTVGSTRSNSSSFSNEIYDGGTIGLTMNAIQGKQTGPNGDIEISTVPGDYIGNSAGETDDVTETSTSSNTVTLNYTTQASDTVTGFPTSYEPGGIPAGDHLGDWDQLDLWLNPVLDFMAYPAYEGAPPAIQWLGYVWDPATISGNPAFGGIFHAYIHAGCLNGDWESDGISQHQNLCANEQDNLNRDWAPLEDQHLESPSARTPLSAAGCSPQSGNSPSICPNTQDAYQILKADSLAYNPGIPGITINPMAPPQTTSNGQYTQLCWSPADQPKSNLLTVCPNNISYTAYNYPAFSLTYMNTQAQAGGSEDTTKSSVTVSSSSGFNFLSIFGFSSSYTETDTITETTSFNVQLTQAQTVADAYTIKPDTPNYGTPDYLVYQDNFFGTFAFVPYNP